MPGLDGHVCQVHGHALGAAETKPIDDMQDVQRTERSANPMNGWTRGGI